MNPEKEITPEESRRLAASVLGKAKTEKKAAAARKNGKKHTGKKK